MRARAERHGDCDHGRGGRAADQARPPRHALLAAALLLLAGCSGIPRDIDPRLFVGNLFGAHLDGREPPPGANQPWPNLASVPPRPVPPDAATRAALSAELAADREGSRTPRGLLAMPPGQRALPLAEGPPPPPRLAAAPALPAAAAPPPAGPVPAAALPDGLLPGVLPAAPGADLLAPAPRRN
jgi:hypothetical protein